MNTNYALPATLTAYVSNHDLTDRTRENIHQLVSGWVASPMVEIEGSGQYRLDIFGTMHNLKEVVLTTCMQSDEEIRDAIREFIGYCKSKQEALDHLKQVFQGYIGSVVVQKAGDEVNRASVAGTYYELERLIKDLFVAYDKGSASA